MDNEKDLVPSESSSTKEAAKPKRSASYPAITIQEALEFATRINSQFSSVADVSREEIAFAFNLNAGSIIRDISSCVQYNLLSKNTKEGKYRLTKLFTDIFKPDSERDKRLALIEAFSSPKLYQKLIERYDNASIPIELKNVLVKYYDITESASDSAAITFIESAKYVGVLNEGGVLRFNLTKSTLTKTQFAEVIDVVEQPTEQNNSLIEVSKFEVQDGNKNKVPKKSEIHLTGDKIAYLVYPNDLTEKDIKIINHQIQGILLRIELEQEEKKEGHTTEGNSDNVVQ